MHGKFSIQFSEKAIAFSENLLELTSNGHENLSASAKGGLGNEDFLFSPD